MDELTQIIDMLAYRDNTKRSSVAMDFDIRVQLRDFVLTIAGTYRDVPSHNFEHASHVIMSSEKLMKRIVNRDGINYEQDTAAVSKQIYDLTYGISQDPLFSKDLSKTPAEGWFRGELWHFDNYIIPMAQKLIKYGVFGVSYQESLTYALENRRDWEIKGNNSFCGASLGALQIQALSEDEDPSESFFELTEAQCLMSHRHLL